MVQTLIELGLPLDLTKHNGVTALGVAAHSGNLKMLEYLASAGADVNFISQQGITALFLAVKSNRLDCAKFLVGKGAMIHIGSGYNQEYSPVLFAVRQGNLPALLILCEGGQDLDNIKVDQQSLIHFAFEMKN